MSWILTLALFSHACVASSIAAPSPAPQPPFNRGMIARQPHEMVRAREDVFGLGGDKVEVHWNLSPLLEEQFQEKLGNRGLFHGSVGFTNLRTGLNSTIEFAAINFDLSLILPTLNSSTRELMWNNSGVVKPFEGVLDTYYWQNRTKLATITGRTYNKMLDWLEHAMKTYQTYNLFALSSPAGVVQQDQQFDGFTCFDFNKAALEQIAKIEGHCFLDRSLPGVFVDDVMMVQAATGPVQSLASPDEAFRFYEAVLKIPDLKTFSVRRILAEMALLRYSFFGKGHIIYYSNKGDYWQYTSGWPHLKIIRHYTPLPGKCGPEEVIAV